MRPFLTALLSLPFLLTSLCAAVQNVDCRRPQVFPGAAVNAVILPYQYIGSNDRIERSQAAQRLGLILQRDILLALLRYPSIAAVQMIRPRDAAASCDPETIVNQLLGNQPGARSTLLAGHGAVFLWGVLYEEGDDLYVRSFLRFLRRVPNGDQVTMSLGSFKFTGPMPVDSVAFPPVRITAVELGEIERLFRESSLLRPTPDASQPGTEIPFTPMFPFAYTVQEARGEWIRVKPLEDGPDGWMHIESRTGPWSLRTRMPEIHFLVSVVGYLQALMFESAGDSAQARRMVDISRQALSDFENTARLEKAAETASAVRTLSARLRLIRERDVEAWKAAVADLDKAVQLDRSSAELRNFQTMCRAWLAFNRQADYPAGRLAEDFRDAAARSSNRQILSNLATLYRVMLAGPTPAADSIRAELAKVEKIMAAQPGNP